VRGCGCRDPRNSFMTASPVISVMIPTYEPDDLLVQTVRAVLAQTSGRGSSLPAIEITVVDDASPTVDVAALVSRADPDGRVELVRNSQQLGLAGNWNRAIGLARGEWIHLLHQDDYVLPNFYRRMGDGFWQRPDVGMAFCRTRIVDQADQPLKTSSRVCWRKGVVSNWLLRIGERQRVQTPAVVVARGTYEQVGGFREDLCHALDWEMWVRIAAHYPVWYDPKVLAVYRRHECNESSRLLHSGKVWPDLARAISINARTFPAAIRDRLMERSTRWYAQSVLRTATKQLRAGDIVGAQKTLYHVPRLLELIRESRSTPALARRAGAIEHRLRLLRAA
jgi:GT2 family glycosyltransferase